MPTYRDISNVNRLLKRQYQGVSAVNREIKEQYRGVSGTNRLVFTARNIELEFDNVASFTGTLTAVNNGTTIVLTMNGTATSGIETRVRCRVRGLNVGDNVSVTIAYTRSSGSGVVGYFRDDDSDFYAWSSTVSGTFSGTLRSGDNIRVALTSAAISGSINHTITISKIEINGKQLFP